MPNAQVQAINIPDVVLGLVLVIGLFVGLAIGLFRQTIVLASAYVAALIASRLYVVLAPSIPLSISPNATVRSAIAFGVLFVLFLVLLIWLTHYIPNPIGWTSQLTFLSGRAAAAVVGFFWAFLIVGMIVTVAVLALGGSWGAENERTQLQWRLAIRQSTVVQVLNTAVWPISKTAWEFLPFGPFLPS